MASKIAVVTGGNKGIGFAIVRGLCQRFDGLVYLTSRDENRGKNAVSELEKEGLKPKFYQLDVTDTKSLEIFHDYIKKEHGSIDILVNNAAIAFNLDATESAIVQAEETLRVNYFAFVKTCEILLPLVKNGGRVVNVSSSAGHLTSIPSQSLRTKLLSPTLTIEEFSGLMQEYIDKSKQGVQVEEWGTSSYAVSKVGVSALTNIQQRMLQDKDIKVNSVHPGYVDTDMSSHKGHLTTEQGAAAPLFLALDAPDSVQGAYVWHDKRIVPWDKDKPAKY